MSDKPLKENENFIRIFTPHLKSQPISTLEEVVAKAIAGLVGYGYSCRLRKIDFSSSKGNAATEAILELELIRDPEKDGDYDRLQTSE